MYNETECNLISATSVKYKQVYKYKEPLKVTIKYILKKRKKILKGK